jgi:hypothetical protein
MSNKNTSNTKRSPRENRRLLIDASLQSSVTAFALQFDVLLYDHEGHGKASKIRIMADADLTMIIIFDNFW